MLVDSSKINVVTATAPLKNVTMVDQSKLFQLNFTDGAISIWNEYGLSSLY